MFAAFQLHSVFAFRFLSAKEITHLTLFSLFLFFSPFTFSIHKVIDMSSSEKCLQRRKVEIRICCQFFAIATAAAVVAIALSAITEASIGIRICKKKLPWLRFHDKCFACYNCTFRSFSFPADVDVQLSLFTVCNSVCLLSSYFPF